LGDTEDQGDLSRIALLLGNCDVEGRATGKAKRDEQEEKPAG
jgi:hypothetical protein